MKSGENHPLGKEKSRKTDYSKHAFSFIVLLLAVLVLQYVGMQYLENYIAALHFWTFMGLLFSLPKLANKPDGNLTSSPDAPSPSQHHT